ncbi:Ig-like domain-containing protein [Flavobacterium litorale]|uniref:T9SS type A sorting domain-containing protein n=1 Tax=Flavobacterium litorale TaxID=2856519 RepID=A0ABX8VB61_9FLAO|nr:T9SS type A sorting domain-containing protein [Flavobacterium litorale]QYJ68050.1 T9SS type A sorting domain-containing protein [Flavobacterium litorale]
MKKITLLIGLMLCAVTVGYAQATLYSFQQSNGTYVPITGGTVINSSTDGTPNLDSYTSPQQTFPAPFLFAGTSYDNFYVTSNGQVGLGTSSPSTTNYTVLSSSTGGNVFLAPFSADLEEGANGLAEIRTEMVGDEMVIQWTNFRRYARAESFNMQVRLNTVTGNIQFVYDGTPPYAASSSYQPQVGIKSAIGSALALTVAAGTSWDTPTLVTGSDVSSSSKAVFNGADGFTSGLTYTWLPPAPCAGTPLAGTVNGDTMRYVCNGSTPSAISVSDASPLVPGISYQWQESLNGTDWTDVTDGSGADTASFTPAEFDGTSIQYRMSVTCSGSAETVFTDAVTIDNQIAPTTQVSDVEVTNVGVTSLTINWTNGNGGRRYVLLSTVLVTDPTSANGVAAFDDNNEYNGAGEQLVYDGTSTSVTVSGLSCNTTYYIKVYEYNRCGSDPYDVYFNTDASTNDATVTTGPATAVALPVENDFDGFTGANLSTVIDGWYEASVDTDDGDVPVAANPAGTSSTWRSATILGGNTTARINLYTDNRNEWIISPKIVLTEDSRLNFQAAITNYNSSSADPNGMQDTDDEVNVLISTDECGQTWTSLYTFDATTTTDLSNTLTDFEILLNAYTGQTIQIAFQATDGPDDDSPDYDFHIGNIVIEEVPLCDVPTVSTTVANITKNSASISWQAPAVGVPTGYEYVVSDTNTTPAGAGTATTDLSADVSGLTPSTDYYIFVRTNCGGSFSDWTEAVTFATLCDYPEIVTTTPATICGQGTVNLLATADGGTISWYADMMGGDVLATGESFTSEEINETTTYYVVAEEVGAPTSGGARASTTSTSNTSASNYGLVFDAFSSFTLNSVDIYLTSSSAGTLELELQNSDGDELLSASVAVPAGNSSNPVVFTVNLGWDIPAGEDLRIVAVSGPSMVRELALGGYPYAVGTVASVTDGYVSGIINTTYYYFYNWNYNGICAGPRVPVVATVTDAPEITVSDDDSICPGESSELTVTSANTDYTYNWMPGNLDGAIQTVTPTVTTTYTVTATDAVSGCVTEAEVTVTVNPLPSAIVIDSPATACVDTVLPLEITGGTLGGVATVGDGTNTTDDTEELTAFSNRRETYKSQTIYTAADLEAVGLGAGTIIAIGYDIIEIGDSATNDDYTVKMGTTILDEFPDDNYLDETGFTTVFNPATYTHAVGVNTVTFDTPFEWDGTSNIVISVSHSGDDDLYNAETYYTDLGNNTTIYNYDDLDATDGIVSTKRLNVTFSISGSTDVTWLPIDNLYTDEDATVAYTEGTPATMVYFKSADIATTTYTVTATSEAGCAVSNTVEVTVTETAAPTVDAATVTLCNAGTVADLMATGDNIQWYDAATDGNLLTAETALVDGTSYYASQTIDGCESTDRTEVAVTINVTAAPTVDAATVTLCNAGIVAELMATGDNIQWYDAATDGNLLTAETALVDGTSYYASQTIDGCESTDRTEVAVTINVTAAPTVDAATVTLCNAGTVADLMATGDNIQWYDAATDGNLLTAETALVDGTSYYASQTIDGCESTDRTEVAVTINVTAAPTVDAATVTLCNAGTVADLMATGDNIQWYDAATDGNLLTAETALVDGTSYYASQTIDGCESTDRTEVAVTINVTAAPTGDANQSITENSPANATIEDIVVTGDNVIWYATEADAIVGENPLPITTGITNGTTYYATQTLNGCESDAVLAVTMEVILSSNDFNRNKFSFYPNPVKDVLTVSYNSEITSVAVFNLLGQQVMAEQPNTSEVKLDMTSLSDGTYLVTITAGNIVETIKIVKKQ